MKAVPVSPLPSPAALAAFLRGVERRGAVLAELQCGDAAGGDAALAAAMEGFRAVAAELPMSDWPRAFWARLLAQPRLRHRTALAMPLDATDNLAELGSGPRAALLLRLAAGLTEPEAAAVLGIAQPTYRLALRRALPSHADGSADAQAWQRLREQVHRRIKTLPTERLLRLTRAREAVLLGQGVAAALPPGRTAAPSAPAPGRRWMLVVLWSLLALCAAALVATFWWPLGAALEEALGRSGNPHVRVQPLDPADAPAARYGREAGLVADRDFALLGDDDGLRLARDLDFYNWLAAQQATAATDGSGLPLLAAVVDPALVADPTADVTIQHVASQDAATATETLDAPR